MATTVHEPPKAKSDNLEKPLLSHNGGWRNPVPLGGGLRFVDDSSPASRTGIWVGVAAITMTFAAFTSAMIVRQASSNDWRHFSLPMVLYLNAVILVASSAVLEKSRNSVAAYLAGDRKRRVVSLLWLGLTLALGLVFVVGQYVAWQQLRAKGLYLATNPSSSFFYVFTALHAIHVIGGLAGLTLVTWRLSRPVPTLRLSTLSTVRYYWHFMGVLWIYLLLLLWMRI